MNNAENILDLKAYSGIWYEIIRKNAFYEIGCDTAVASYEAVYNQLLIQNYCYNKSDVVKVSQGPSIPGFPELSSSRSIKGVATATSQPLVFDVTFEGNIKGKYKLLFTDYQYFSIVGDPATQYLSVLSRKPTITSSEQSLLIKILRDLGFQNYEYTYNGSFIHSR